MTAPAPVPIEQWPGLVVGAAVAEGDRSQVWQGELAGRTVAIRRSKHPLPSLAWELQLLVDLDATGFVVPVPIQTASGLLHWDQWNVQTWLDGREPHSPADWQAVADTLRQIHRRFRRHSQRPGAAAVTELTDARRSVGADLDQTPADIVTACVAHIEPYLGAQRSVIHGDVHRGNIRIDAEGRVGLLDWDEARVDVTDLDLSNLGVPVLSGRRREAAEAMADAWETLNGWLIEPDYARSRFQRLQPPAGPTPPVILDGGGVTLRPRTEADVDAQLAGEDDVFTTWLTGGRATADQVRTRITNAARCGAADGMRLNLGIYLSGVEQPLIGNLDINYADIDLALDEINLSYGVFEPWRRQRYGRAALALALDFLQRSGRHGKPTLKIDPRNEASLALARSLGFAEARTIIGLEGELLILQRPHR